MRSSGDALDFTGSWVQDGQVVATIEDDWISWVSGPTAKLHRQGESQISVDLDGFGEVQARYDGKGTLSWRDGDVWVMSPRNATSAPNAQRKGLFRKERDACGSASHARTWQRCGGSGGAGTSDAFQGGTKIDRRFSNKSLKTYCATSLLPCRDAGGEAVPNNPSLSIWLARAAERRDGMHFGSAIYGKSTDDVVIRVILHEQDPKLLSLELNSLETYNMMDPMLSKDLDWAFDVVNTHIKRTQYRGQQVYGVQTQGAGPHFCPGGNPNPFKGAMDVTNPQLWQHSRFGVSQVVGYSPFCRVRELAVPTIQGSHGAQVGGGNAFALNHTVRACDAKTTIAFGNLSRGAVPGMILSQTLPSTSGLVGGLDLYLVDGTLSAYGANKASFMTRIYNGVRETKYGAREMVKAMAMNPCARVRTPILIAPFDVDRYMIEGWGIDIAGRGGGQFQNVRMGSETDTSVFVEDFSRGATFRQRPRSLARVSAKAISVHGIEVKYGILSMANFTSQQCWVDLSTDAKVTGSKEHPARYKSDAAKKLHQPAHDLCMKYLDVWRSPSNKHGLRKVDAWQVAEVVAFCLWRDRDMSVEAVKLLPAVALSKLDDSDFRRELLTKNKFNVAVDMSIPGICFDMASRNFLHFEDPVQRFGKDTVDIWWQYLTLGTSSFSSMLVLATLMGALADPNVMLSCDGDEIAEIFMCRGSYTGPVKQIATEQVGTPPLQGVFPVLLGAPVHEWVTVRTVSGNETCIDLSVAQYGDSSRSECSGVPVRFSPADAFKKDVTEEKRDKDIIAVYNEYYWSMMNAREKEGPGRMEEFFSVLGKSCAILGLV